MRKLIMYLLLGIACMLSGCAGNSGEDPQPSIPMATPGETAVMTATPIPELLVGPVLEIMPLGKGNVSGDWWIESEVNVFMESIPVKLTDGTVKMRIYVPKEGLSDGEYAVELHVGPNRDSRTTGTVLFNVNHGKPDIADNKQYKAGYVLEFEVPYSDASSWNSCGLIIKTHSSAAIQNGSIYLGDLRFEDKEYGVVSASIEADELSITAEKLTTGKKQQLYILGSFDAAGKQPLLVTATPRPTATPGPTVTPTPTPLPKQSLFETGLKISTFNNQGKAYSDWWGESEICTYIADVPFGITQGSYGTTAFIKDGELKDGEYGIEISVCPEKNPYTNFAFTLGKFVIKNGKLDTSSLTGATRRKCETGYLIDLVGAYVAGKTEKDVVFILKVHSNVSDENGSIYFGNIFCVDELQGCQYLDLKTGQFDITAERLSTQEEQDVKVVSLAEYGGKDADNSQQVEKKFWHIAAKEEGEDFISFGLAIPLDFCEGKENKSDWWEESEVHVDVRNLSARLHHGAMGFSVYIPDNYLNDGEYGLEMILCSDNSGFEKGAAGYFVITNGKLDVEKSICQAYRRVTDGYVATMVESGYTQNADLSRYYLKFKVHSSSTEKNGELYVTDIFFADIAYGFYYLDFSKENITVVSRAFVSGEKISNGAYYKNFRNQLELAEYKRELFVGETYQVALKNTQGSNSLVYTSSDTAVAIISGDGTITAKKSGQVEITVADPTTNTSVSWIVGIKEPYVSVVAEKTQIVKGDTFTYIGNGFGVDDNTFLWSSSNPTVGTVDTSTGKFTGLSVGTTELTVTGKTSGLSYSFEVEVYEVNNGELKDYITIVTNGLISPELERRITELLYEVYPAVFDYYADGVYSPITCTFEAADGVAYTTGNREIFVSAQYINSNPRDLDCITHELIHCAQNYSTGDNIWLIEGITDYGRNLFGKYNEEAGWRIPGYQEGQHYTDSYGVTAGFLQYVTEVHNDDMIEILNQAFKNNQYSNKLWVVCTGYSLDALWAKYAGKLLSETPTLLYAGESKQLQLIDGYDWKNVSFNISKNKIVEISSDGVMTAKKEGTTWVTITDANGAEISWEVTVKAPYVAPLIEKLTVVQGKTYQYVGMGYGIENTAFNWSSSDAGIGTVDANSGLFTAVSMGTTSLTMTDRNSGKSYSFDVKVTKPKEVDPQDYIKFERSAEIDDALEERLYNLVCDVYIDVFDYFADGEYSTVNCSFGDGDGAAAYAYGENIVIDANFISGNPRDIDCITHELIHCAQKYATGENIWLIEGITDYGRSLFGRFNEDAGWSLQTYRSGQEYTDSYTVTGGFLKYVVENHNENIVRILNAAFKKNEYHDRIWTDNTGYTIDELWELYSMQ